MTATRVVLWRHGQTGHNAADRFQGQLDVPLDDVGREQAREAAAMLVGLPPARIVSSDLSRALDTAAALADLTGLHVEIDPELRELFAGQWQGLLREEIEARWPADFAAWRGGDDVPVGGGERRSDAAKRAAAAIERHTAATPDGVLVVTAHGGALRGAMLELLGLPISAWPSFAGLANAHWAVLDRRPSGWSVAEYNVGPRGAHVGSEG
ncbi:MAG: histidine phosphatase family protein [Actinomycetes bacterium]